MSHPYPEEPDPHVTDPGHGGEDKVHGDGGDENIIQWENLKEEEKHQRQLHNSTHTHNKHLVSGFSIN